MTNRGGMNAFRAAWTAFLVGVILLGLHAEAWFGTTVMVGTFLMYYDWPEG